MSDPAPDVYRARSVAFTNVEPNSAAQIGIGDGPEAYAAGAQRRLIAGRMHACECTNACTSRMRQPLAQLLVSL